LAPNPGEFQVSNKLAPETVDALIDKLANDDAFRAQFMANPRAATRSLGTADPAVESLPEAPIRRLADKEVFQRSGATIRQSLISSKFPFEPITLEINR